MEDLVLGEHIKLGLFARNYKVHAHHGFVSRFEGIHHKCGTRIECVCLKRHFGIVIRCYEQNTFADTMKPVCDLVVCFSLARTVKVLVQLADLCLNAFFAGRICARLLEQITVLEINYLRCRIHLDNIQNVLTGILCAVKDRLNAPCVPVQEVLLEEVLYMEDECFVQFLYDILSSDFVKGCIDVLPTVHIVTDHIVCFSDSDISHKFVCHKFTP